MKILCEEGEPTQTSCDAPANIIRNADSPVGLEAWLLDHGEGMASRRRNQSDVLGRTINGHPATMTRGRSRRRHHALLVDQHGGLCGSASIGKTSRR